MQNHSFISRCVHYAIYYITGISSLMPLTTIAQSTPPPGFEIFECGMDSYTPPPDDGNYIYSVQTATCTDVSKVRYIRVAYHYMLNSDGSGNFSETGDGLGSSYNGYQRTEDVIEKANSELSHNPQHWLPSGNTTPIENPNYQYLLTGVYFHRNTLEANQSISSAIATLPSKYGVSSATTINIFMTATSGTSGGQASGIGSQTNTTPATSRSAAMKTRSSYIGDPVSSKDFEGYLLNHEIGHLLGLYHTWNTSYKCTTIDTPLNSGCWAWDSNTNSPCNSWSNISNNMMDYNLFYPHATTPCQHTMTNKTLSTNNNSYIYSCGDCVPVYAFFTLRRGAGNFPIAVATASSNETRWKVDVCEVPSIGSTTCIGSFFSTGWINGQAGVVDFSGSSGLGTYYNFQLGHYYQITLSVGGDNCQGTHSAIKYYGVPRDIVCTTCESSANPVFSIGVFPNPVSSILNVEHFSENPGRLLVQVRDQNGNIVSTPVQNIAIEGGSYQMEYGVENLQNGWYNIIAVFNGEVDTEAFIKNN